MTKSDLVRIVAEQMDMPYTKAKQVVEVFFGAIFKELIQGSGVEIRGFGSFRVKDYPGYVGRNPKSGESVQVKPKKGVVFRVGRELRKLINNAYLRG